MKRLLSIIGLILLTAFPALATVSVETTRVSYTCNGVLTTYAYPFKVLADADILAIKTLTATGAESTLALNTDYTVTGAGTSGGNVVLTAGSKCGSGYTITILRNIAATQETDYVDGEAFSAESFENALDKVTMIQQQQKDQLSRVPMLKATTGTSAPTLADPVAGQYLRWNLLGTGIESATSVSTTGNFLQSGTGAVSRTVDSKIGEAISVMDFGAVGNGTTDDAAAINAACAAVATAGGGYVYVPGKTFKIASTVYLYSGVHLIGQKGATTLSYTGAGTAVNIVSSSGSGTRIYSGGLRDMLISTSTGVTGVDIDSLSGGIFENVQVAGFSGSSWKLHSSTSGGAVYNRFYNCQGSGATSTTSFELSKTVVTGSVTNSNTFIGCRAGGATGFAISGGNQNQIIACQIETCTTGIAITEPNTASVSGNAIAFNRFENNTTNISIGAGVTSTFGYGNYHVGGIPYSDSGTRTQILEPAVGGSNSSGYQFSSPSQIATGSFQFTRSGNGGSSVPAMVVRDTNTSSGTPVTLQIETERTGTFLRGQKGAVKYFDVSTAGLGNFRSGTMVSSATSGGGLKRMYAEATANIEADASTTITLSIPTGARLLGAQLRVDAALATGETWDAAYSGGSTTAIASAQAVAKNTKVNTMYNENGASPITTNTTNIAITKNGGGAFTAQGTIRAIVYYETAVAMDDAP